MCSPSDRFSTTKKARGPLGFVLITALLVACSSYPAAAAPITGHSHSRATENRTPAEIASLEKMWNQFQSSGGVGKFIPKVSFTNPDGTLKGHLLARLLHWHPRTPVVATAGNTANASISTSSATPRAETLSLAPTHAAVQSEAQLVASSISSTPRNPAVQVLIPPAAETGTGTNSGVVTISGVTTTTSTTTRVVQTEVLTVPEPSSWLVAVGLLGAAYARRRQKHGSASAVTATA